MTTENSIGARHHYRKPQSGIVCVGVVAASLALGPLPARPDQLPAPTGAAAPTAPLRASKRPPSPMLAEMLQVVEQQRQALADLQARLREARDERTALDLQREAEQLKMGTEIALLRIQASYARREGRIKTAQEIEAAVETLLHPLVPKAAPESPAPSQPQRQR